MNAKLETRTHRKSWELRTDHLTRQELLNKLEGVGRDVWDDVLELVREADFERNPQVHQFVMGSLEELFGFTTSTQNKVFLNEGFLSSKRLAHCTSTDAFYVGSEYPDQPAGEWVRCGMKQIPDSDHCPLVLRIGRNLNGSKQPFIMCGCGHQDVESRPESLWLFRMI